MSLVIIDGNSYDVGIVKITRKASQSRENIGITMDQRKHYDVKGTYFDYDVHFNLRAMNVTDYDLLYEVLTEPVEYHTVTLPYGQSSITFIANIKYTEDSLVRNFNQMKRWGGFKVTFEALEPQKEA